MLWKIYTEFPKENVEMISNTYRNYFKMQRESTLYAKQESRNTVTQAHNTDKSFWIFSFNALINILTQESCKNSIDVKQN